MNKKTQTVVTMGLLTAIVVALQFVSMNIRVGMFSITLSLIPMVVGAALYGKWAGAWLGLVFGVTVLATGDANAFLALSIHGTIITVLVKGILSGFAVGFVYDLLKKKNDTLATYVSGVLAPIVNTGVFVLGCLVFFMDFIRQQAGETNALLYVLVTFVSFNIFIELAVNLVLSPTIAKIVKLAQKQ